MTNRTNPSLASLMEQAIEKGWVPDKNQSDGNPVFVPVWLYSYGYEAGCRVHGQLIKDVHDNGLPKDLLASLTLNPGDAYVGMVDIVDSLQGGSSERDNQMLIALMFNYTRSTRLWSTLPSYNSVPGIHVVLVDWYTRSNQHILVQAASIQPGLMTPQQIADASRMAMEAHLARHPNERPRSRAQAH